MAKGVDEPSIGFGELTKGRGSRKGPGCWPDLHAKLPPKTSRPENGRRSSRWNVCTLGSGQGTCQGPKVFVKADSGMRDVLRWAS